MKKEERIASMEKILKQLNRERVEAEKRLHVAQEETKKIIEDLFVTLDKQYDARSRIGRNVWFPIRWIWFLPSNKAVSRITEARKHLEDFVDAKKEQKDLTNELKKSLQSEDNAESDYKSKLEEVEKVQTVIAAYKQATEAADEIISQYANQP